MDTITFYYFMLSIFISNNVKFINIIIICKFLNIHFFALMRDNTFFKNALSCIAVKINATEEKKNKGKTVFLLLMHMKIL